MLTETEPTFSLAGTPFLEYLPVVDLSNGRLLGMEALVRWQHPDPGPDLTQRADPACRGERGHRAADPVGGDGGVRAGLQLVARASSWASTAPSTSSAGVRSRRRWPPPWSRPGFRSGQLTLEVTEDAIVDPAASADLQGPLADGRAALGGRRRHQLVVVRAVQAPLDQHRQDRRLVHRRPRVHPGHQPTGGGDGDPHGPLARDVGHRGVRWRRRPRWRSSGPSTPMPPRGSSSPGPCPASTPPHWPAAPRCPSSPAPRSGRLRPHEPADGSAAERRGESGRRPTATAGP